VPGFDLGDEVLLGELHHFELRQVQPAISRQIDKQPGLGPMRRESKVVGEVSPLAVGGGSERRQGAVRCPDIANPQTHARKAASRQRQAVISTGVVQWGQAVHELQAISGGLLNAQEISPSLAHRLVFGHHIAFPL